VSLLAVRDSLAMHNFFVSFVLEAIACVEWSHNCMAFVLIVYYYDYYMILMILMCGGFNPIATRSYLWETLLHTKQFSCLTNCIQIVYEIVA